MEPTSQLLPSIETAITPMILISGLGLLLLTMTNRMGRIMDRTRDYTARMRSAGPDDRRHLDEMLQVTWRRAKIVRLALTFVVSSMLMTALLVIALFLQTFLRLNLNDMMLALFVTAILLLIAALSTFSRDVFLSLAALKTEVKWARSHH
jgi:hypothetical protein